jgi:hypothetical protein
MRDRPVEQPLRPRELECEHRKPDRDDEQRGAGQHEHGDAARRHGRAGHDDGRPMEAPAPPVGGALLGESGTHALRTGLRHLTHRR